MLGRLVSRRGCAGVLLLQNKGAGPLPKYIFGAFSTAPSPASPDTRAGPNSTIKLTPEQAKSKAHQILQYFPGGTVARKAAYATISGGLISWLVANGIYIPNDETIIVLAFGVVVRVLYVKLREPVNALIESSMSETRSRIAQSRVQQLERNAIDLGELESYRDYADVVAEHYSLKAENALLEAELAQLQESNRFWSGIKSRLEEAARKAAEKKRQERAELIGRIMRGVLEELKGNKVQDALLKQCLQDLEKAPLRGI